jgi:hypothetical protein
LAFAPENAPSTQSRPLPSQIWERPLAISERLWSKALRRISFLSETISPPMSDVVGQGQEGLSIRAVIKTSTGKLLQANAGSKAVQTVARALFSTHLRGILDE